MRRVWILVLAALLLLPSLVLASHNMGHRYYVTGRAIDAGGNPIQGQSYTIRLIEPDGHVVSSIVGTTDCFGDWHSLRGTRGPENEPKRFNDEGYGEIESFPATDHYPAYSNFHFHSYHLSDRLKFSVTVGNDTWDVGFDSKRRQTVDYHQTASTYPPSATCAGGFSAFQTTLTVRVFLANQDDMQGVERGDEVHRPVELSYEGVTQSGESNFFNEYDGQFNNTTVQAGRTVRLKASEVGERDVRIGEKEAKFHRVDSVNVVGAQGGGISMGALKYVGIGVLVIAVVAGLYFGGNKMRDRMAEKRLRETSTRRRFRKEREP